MKTSRVVILSLLLGGALGSSTAAYQFLRTSADLNLPGTPKQDWETVAELAPPVPGGPEPRLSLSEEEHDFGVMERGAKGSHGFIVTNTGDYPLEIQHAGSSCSCTLSNLKKGEKVRITPGSSYEVKVDWEVNVKNDFFRQAVHVMTNDPQRALVQLIVSGKVSKSYEVHPSDLAFSTVPIDEPKTIQAELVSYLDEPLEILEHNFSDGRLKDHFDLETESIPSDKLDDPAAKSGAVIKVTVKPGLAVGPFSQQLKLVTNLKGRTEISIPIHGIVAGPISVMSGPAWMPQRNILLLGEFKSSEGVRKTLNLSIRGKGAEEIELKPIRIHPDILRVSFGEKKVIRGGDNPVVFVPMTVEVKPGAKAASYLSWEESGMGDIVLETTHPEVPQFRMLVRFAIVE